MPILGARETEGTKIIVIVYIIASQQFAVRHLKPMFLNNLICTSCCLHEIIVRHAISILYHTDNVLVNF